MKKLFGLILTLVAAVALVGCGGTEQKDPSIAENNYTVETIENLKAQADDSVLVSFRIPFGTNIQAIIREFADEFEAEYPSVKIELDVVSGYDEMKDATIQDINGGQVPTMTVGYPDHFAEYLISKAIVSLDKFIEDPNVGYTTEELADFLPGYVTENRQFDKKGTYVGLPFNKSTEALYYNVEFFQEFGLEVPKTWDEMDALCAQVMEIVKTLENDQYSWLGKIKDNLDNGEFIPCLYDSGGNLFTTIIHQFGGKYTESIYKSNGLVDVQRGTLKFNTSNEAFEAMEYLQGLAKKGYVSMPDALELTYGSYAYNVGKAIMNIGSTGGSGYYADAICTTGVAPLPYKTEDHKNVIQQGTNVCIMAQASDLEKLAAWLFIKYMLQPEKTADFAMTTGYMPVRQSAYELQDYIDWLEGPTNAAKVHKATSQYASEGWEYFVDAAWAGSSTVRNECETAMVQILVNQTDINQALQDAVGRIG
jgi:multiple sugar transport system substrate-binding protein